MSKALVELAKKKWNADDPTNMDDITVIVVFFE